MAVAATVAMVRMAAKATETADRTDRRPYVHLYTVVANVT